MEAIALIISILAVSLSMAAVFISWLSYRESSYRLDLKIYWNVLENIDGYPETAKFTAIIVNKGGAVINLKNIGATTAARERDFMGSTIFQRKSVTLKSFEPPLSITPKCSEEVEIVLNDKQLTFELDEKDATIWVEDGMLYKHVNAMSNGRRNKKMHRTRKDCPGF